MNESICRFMPAKAEEFSAKAVRFVYETQCRTLTQPFLHPIYVFHLVTRGTAVLRLEESEYTLKRGDVFFAFPAYPYYLDADEDFAYIYVSFMGGGVSAWMMQCNILPATPCYSGYGFLCPMFENAIRRITPSNANMLAEGVLYYALSYFDLGDETADAEAQKGTGGLFDALMDYVDRHYRESDLSLARLSGVFSYTEKYLSSLFKKHLTVGFVSYLNTRRIQHANRLLRMGKQSMAEIATACGYSDYAYFSRVFKRITGNTPTEALRYMQKVAEDGATADPH